MAKNSSVDLDIDINADGFAIGGGSTARKINIQSGDITLTGEATPQTYTFPPASTTLVGIDHTHSANQISGQTGGTDGKVIRISAADTWVDATQADTVDQLRSLAFKQGGNYYTYGAYVTGLTGLASGTVYYLDATGGLTATVPTPSATVRLVAIGTAINTTTLYFTPGTPIGGE